MSTYSKKEKAYYDMLSDKTLHGVRVNYEIPVTEEQKANNQKPEIETKVFLPELAVGNEVNENTLISWERLTRRERRHYRSMIKKMGKLPIKEFVKKMNTGK